MAGPWGGGRLRGVTRGCRLADGPCARTGPTICPGTGTPHGRQCGQAIGSTLPRREHPSLVGGGGAELHQTTQRWWCGGVSEEAATRRNVTQGVIDPPPHPHSG